MHVFVPMHLCKIMPKNLLAEHEWRSWGFQMGHRWKHYGFFKPDSNVVLFRRKYEPRQAAEPDGPDGPAPLAPDDPAEETVNYFDDGDAPPAVDNEAEAPEEAPILDSGEGMDVEEEDAET